MGAKSLPAPRVELIEGRPTLVVERRPPLRVTFRAPIKITGWRGECGRQDHRLVKVLGGRHLGTDLVVRDLEVHQCRDCEAICIRDVSFDTLPGLAPGRLAPRRRNHVLAWYTGARRNQRVYA
jgi:hypothetical protein